MLHACSQYLLFFCCLLQPCNECGEDFCLYNTNVMYDKRGRYVAKYHKYNLFNSEFPLFNIDREENNVYVDTEFGKFHRLFTHLGNPESGLTRRRTHHIFSPIFSTKLNFVNKCLIQFIKNPILQIPNFNFPNLRCCKVFFLFL